MASSVSSTAILLLSTAFLLSLLTSPVSAADRLNGGTSLVVGQSLKQGVYLLTMQNDCNLVLYDGSREIWASGTNGKASDCYVTMQLDGNLVIYSGRIVIWASNTNRQQGNYYLILQRDRNVVIYDNYKNAIWATGTNIVNAVIAVIPHSNGTAVASGAAQNKVKELYS